MAPLALLLGAAACVTDSRAGGGGIGGHGGVRADSGTGAGGGSGSTRTCSITPTGCFCLQGTDPGLGACDETSVTKNAGEQGLCCDDGSQCNCAAYACKNNGATQICECGTSFTVAMEVTAGTLAAECPAPTGNQKCCQTTDSTGNPLCVCSAADCQGATAVPSCSITRVAVCADGQQSVTSCK